VDILNYEEADDLGSDASVTSGASIVDGEYEGCNGELFGAGPNKGTFLLARLERAMARAERMTSTTDVSLSRLAAVEQRLASLVDQAERLTKAQTQAAELEQVCGAVRKVFAGLAEATLQAQRQTEELRGMGEDVTTRLTELTAETEHAAQTLHEWVEEAVRTQSRLERTLSVCPPIRQTHPTEAVRRLSRAVEPFARISAEAAGGQLQVLSEPDFDAIPVEPRVAKPPTRAEEISRLISDGKRQEAGAPA
jgi:chromosome segregation ATPase